MESQKGQPIPEVEAIVLDDVRTHNLKGIHIEFPLNMLSVVTGVSGSGKSSLVFDSLFAESSRRYLDSLSSFARQYIEALPKPMLGQVQNLPPAIAVKQTKGGSNKRSTVGTLTELNDLFQIIFSKLAQPRCPTCQRDISAYSVKMIQSELNAQERGLSWTLTCSLDVWTKLTSQSLHEFLGAQGFVRVFQDGSYINLDECELDRLHEAELVVDRVKNTAEASLRLNESLKTAYRLGKGRVCVRQGQDLFKEYRQSPECVQCQLSLPAIKPALFSYNHPLGACARCHGYGDEASIDWDKVFPDLNRCVADEGIVAINFGQHRSYYDEIRASSSLLSKPFRQYSDEEWEWLKNGDGKKFTGIAGYFAWLDTKKYKPHYRMHRAKFTRYLSCRTCQGTRYSAASLSYLVGGKTIADINRMSIESLSSFVAGIAKTDQQELGKVAEAVAEVSARLAYLEKIGLPYLALGRTAPSLSGGELQRIHLARCLGTSLTDTLFCLDEPTAGLHAHDSENLLGLLFELRDQGNTVVVVEHEKLIIAGADKRFEIGPKAGHLGGELMAPEQVSSGSFSVPPTRVKQCEHFLKLHGARIHNLKGDSLVIPIGQVIVVCGLSGSGKTSLIQHSLYPALLQHLSSSTGSPKLQEENDGMTIELAQASQLASVHLVSQAPLGKSSRSNIVTYLDILTPIRQLLAAQASAKRQNLGAGHFSFNVAGGRCEPCKGMGLVTEDLSFLGEIEVVCTSCKGKRFQNKVLSVTYRSLNILDLLDLKVAQAREFFWDQEKICRALDEVIAMGLGYITLGQHTRSFSGGEAQRLKLLNICKESKKGQGALLIFDEPSAGLADSDVAHLVSYFRGMREGGHTVLVIEHNLDMIRSADYVVELGPHAAENGGEIVFQGSPQELKSCERSLTRRYL